MNSETKLSKDTVEVLFLGQTNSSITSSSFSSSGSRLFIGVEGGVVESSLVVREDENAWCSDTVQRQLHLKVL